MNRTYKTEKKMELFNWGEGHEEVLTCIVNLHRF